MRHAFQVFYEPRIGRELDAEVHECCNCWLQIEDPHDVCPIPEGPSLDAMCDEWLDHMGYGIDCDLRIVGYIQES